ncbi:hypothetical protein RS130_16065 [Paraglaciecola aquimarina]|uniref:Uncharacterized protein n=1 Tax=Paraglaciecola aquimarina TaxID=1235557 RepID=A0ABU3SYW5_9ALTE|nr:hypothetical protein [Paraglaciecola aquimarina]MDU0355213.1 hypothetical protein [Paraglaciecola aquimarina]
MEETNTTLTLMQQFHVFAIAKGFLILIIGYLLARLARNGVGRLKIAQLTTHGMTLLKESFFTAY